MLFDDDDDDGDEERFLPRGRVKPGELVQDVNLHRSDLAKPIGGVDKLLYRKTGGRGERHFISCHGYMTPVAMDTAR